MSFEWDLLRCPENFEALPGRSDVGRILCLWHTGGTLHGISYSVFETHAPHGYVVRRIAFTRDAVYGDEAPASDELVNEVLAAFEALHLPPFRRPTAFGCDGQTTGAIFGTTWRRTDIQWWSGRRDNDWEPLEKAWGSARFKLEQLFAGHQRQYLYF